MKTIMPYSLYKKGYANYPAANYNSTKKSIEVDLPEYKKPNFPSDWTRIGNRYKTPNGCTVYFWAKGYAENFLVEHYVSKYNCDTKTINPGLYAREKVIEYVASFG